MNLRLVRRRWRVVQFLAAIILTMALCGLWHGAGWNFVLWGTVHGFALAFAVAWRSSSLPGPPFMIGWALTLVFFLLSGILFRAGSIQGAWNIYQGLAVMPNPGFAGARMVMLGAAAAILLPPGDDLRRRLIEQPRTLVAAALGLIGTATLFEIGPEDVREFIYFQF
jgi:hypothetical protein